MAKNIFILISLSQIANMFAYAGMQSILLLYLVQHIFMEEMTANRILGAFGALFCAAHIIGGWVGDKLVGLKPSMLIGSGFLCFGYLCLAMTPYDMIFLYLSLSAISLGNGLFSTNAATLIRALQKENATNIDSAFTLYYLAINIGSVIAKLMVPSLQEHFGWQLGFITCFIGAVFELALQFYMFKRYIPSTSSHTHFLSPPLNRIHKLALAGSGVALTLLLAYILNHEHLAENTIWLCALLVSLLMIKLYIRADSSQRYGLAVLYVLIALSILFFVLFQQMDTSLTLFALRHVHSTFHIGSFALFSWSAGQFKTLNPLWVILLSPIIVGLYRSKDHSSKESSISVKFVWGFFSLFMSFLVWGGFCHFAATPFLSPWVMVAGYLFFSIGEILIGGLGLAIIARFSPPALNGIMMGSYYIASGVATYIGSLVANMAAKHTSSVTSASEDLHNYTHLFLILAAIAGISVVISACFLPKLKKWELRFYAL